MESIRELYRIGIGPSSSHTMGPRKAALTFLERLPETADHAAVTLYGSLAATGKGHLTDEAIKAVFTEAGLGIDIRWSPDIMLDRHPNGLAFTAFNAADNELYSWTAYSIGGGAIVGEDEEKETVSVYPLSTMQEILDWCGKEGRQLWEYVQIHEDAEFFSYLHDVWDTMKAAVRRGLDHEGVLPGGLKLPRKAAQYYSKASHFSGPIGKRSKVYAYALAVSEENASGGTIVTAPTCGSCGVLPGVLLYLKKTYTIPESRIIRAIATAGLIGNLVKTNGSISGAEVGCQGEVGTACAMASAAAAQLMGGTVHQIEYAAEMGLEHHLGLTCDPVKGLVQIPCIERNALAAARALNHMNYVLLSDGRHRISFDAVVQVMKETGEALPSLYRETSQAGLAKWH